TGAILFFRLYSRKAGIPKILLAFAVMAIGAATSIWLQNLITIPLQAQKYVIYYVNGLVLAALPFMIRARSLERDLFLMESVRNSTLKPNEVLSLMKEFVDAHVGDLNIHERYLQALLARGKNEEAIVEARVMLQTDPYNFSASLLLAHAYLQVG